ncbi:hypothetical protein [Actinokineospora pegani]|uniref:hypothetical protein n=1 Tax=Actinokineospora pegani TaxID=2654637 RepID=UPI0018D4D25B|nr:hypothetical protein [Actinokineospora pegani]
MTRYFAVGLWLLGALVDLLSWPSIGSSERSFHMALILMFGAVVFALISRSEEPRGHDHQPTKCGDSH